MKTRLPRRGWYPHPTDSRLDTFWTGKKWDLARIRERETGQELSWSYMQKRWIRMAPWGSQGLLDVALHGRGMDHQPKKLKDLTVDDAVGFLLVYGILDTLFGGPRQPKPPKPRTGQFHLG